MLLALAAALLPVLLGTGFAFLPGAGAAVLGPVRTLAFAAALTVVVAVLLPEAASAQLFGAALVFAAGLALPLLFERLGRVGQGRDGVALELAFGGLALHQVVDGLAIGAAARAQDGVPVALAIAAHSGPLIAVTVLGYATHDGRAAALRRAAGLLAATGLGVGLAALASATLPLDAVEPWVQAALAGLLLHLFGHDLLTDPPRGTAGRAADLAALMLGVGAPLAALHPAERPATLAFLLPLGDSALRVAPTLLLGLLAAALLQASAGPAARLAGGAARAALRGLRAAARRPLSACDALPLARGLSSAGPAFTVAFLLAAPALGLETLALSLALLGGEAAGLRLAGAIALALLAAAVAGLGAAAPRPDALHGALPDAGDGDLFARAKHAFDELCFHVLPWMAVGLLLAAYASAWLSPALVQRLGGLGGEVALAALLTLPTPICAAAAVPLASVLWARGLSGGAMLVGLVLGPAANLSALGFVRAQFGARAAALALSVLLGGGLLLALGADALLPAGPPAESPVSTTQIAATALLGLVVLRSLWQVGARAWLASLASPIDSAALPGLDHHHEHGHHGGHG